MGELIQLENQVYTLQFDGQTKLMSSIVNKVSGVVEEISHQYVAYPSQSFRSGAYLLSVDTSRAKAVFSPADLIDVVIVSGPVWSQLTLMWKLGAEGGVSTFVSSYRLHHTTGPTSEGVYIENMFDFGPAPNMRDTELVMRFAGSLKSGGRLYTDQAGLGVIRRERNDGLDYSGNHYPVTQTAFLQDNTHRLSLLVDHATGATSVQEGHLEVMVDRRTMYDDARGMGEGVTDSRATTHKYWLLLEPKDPSRQSPADILPSLSPLASLLSRHLDNPVTLFSSSSSSSSITPPTVSLLSTPLPCDHHLINLRTWSPQHSPGSSALMILQRTAPDCSWASISLPDCLSPASSPNIVWRGRSARYQPVSLTGNFMSAKSPLFSLAPMEISAYNVTFN